MEEVAADFVGGVVNRVDFVPRRLHLLARNHQLLHAARCGQFAAGAFLLVVNAQEAHEDDDDDGQQAGEVRNRRKVDRDRAGLNRQRGLVGAAAKVSHAAGQNRLDDAHHRQHQRNQQQSRFEVSLDRGDDQREEHKDRPADDPENRAHQHNDQGNADCLVVADKQNRRSNQDAESALYSAEP